MGRWINWSGSAGATNRSSGVRGGDRPGGSSGRCASATGQDGAHGNAATQGRGGWGDGAKGGGVDGDNHRDRIGASGEVVGIALVGGDRRVGAGGGIGNGAGVGGGGATSGASASSAGVISVSFKSMNIGGSGSAALLVKASGAAASGFLSSTITASGAQTLVGKIDDSIKFVNGVRSDFGAAINRLQYTVDNLTSISTNTAASRSRIEDVDYSIATSDLARRNIIQQAATAMLAQANQQPQMVLQLFK